MWAAMRVLRDGGLRGWNEVFLERRKTLEQRDQRSVVTDERGKGIQRS